MPTESPTLTVDIPRNEWPEHAAVTIALVLAWSKDEPGRVGELALMPSSAPGTRARPGRAEAEAGESVPRLELQRQRPGGSERTGPLRSPQLSREHLQLEVGLDGTLRVENIGRATLLHNGRPATHTIVSIGDVLELAGVALFRCSARSKTLPGPAPGAAPWPTFRFGAADSFGIVGESPAAWELRHQVAFIAPRAAHVLIRGPSGAGKELVVQAIHGLSARAGRQMVSRNAATIPEGLIDAELFGNVKNYPNPGMAERPGLVGDPTQQPRLSAALVTALLLRPYRTHVREVEALLWTALSRSGNSLDTWPDLIQATGETAPPEPPAENEIDPLSIPPEVIQEVLDRNSGRQADAWKELGLTSRHVLTRLVRRYGLVVRRTED